MSAQEAWTEVDRRTVTWYLVEVAPPPVPPPPPPIPLPEFSWERLALSALVGATAGALGYGASKKPWVGAVAGAAAGALAYFLIPSSK